MPRLPGFTHGFFSALVSGFLTGPFGHGLAEEDWGRLDFRDHPLLN